MKPKPRTIPPIKTIQFVGISNNCCTGIAIFIYAIANIASNATPTNRLKLGLPLSSSSALFSQSIV